MAFQVNTQEAARQLGVSRRRVGMLLESQALVGEKIGRDWVIRQSSIEAWERRRKGPGRPRLPSRVTLTRILRVPADVDTVTAKRLVEQAKEVRKALKKKRLR